MAYKTKGNTHMMPDGKVMTGRKHTKASKPVKKGSKSMKAKMARLRAMKKK
jgi:hypothetical protein